MAAAKPPRLSLSDSDAAELVRRVEDLGNAPRHAPPRRPLPPLEREPTKTGIAPPARGSAPMPPAPVEDAPLSTTVESPDPHGVPRESPPERRPAHPVRVFTPTDTPAVQDATKRELERKGYQVERAPESLPSSYPRRASEPPPRSVDTRDWWRTAKGIAVAVPVIVAGVTGILGGITNVVVVPIIKAVREPYDGARAKDIAEAKAAGERCDAAVKSERETRQARQKDVDDRVLSVENRISELANRVPEVKPDPSRPPAPPKP